MADFRWHKVSEVEKAEIARDAKKLLEEFSGKINKVKISPEHFENDDGTRPDGMPWKTDDEFREMVLDNAPFVEDGFIIAEKGAWK